jgi:threonine dehydratase
MTIPTRDDVVAAARRLSPLAWRTPLVPSPWLSDLTGTDVRLKLETVQRTGAFKMRGAANALARLKERRPDVSEVVTASAGNHGQAIALAAVRFGIRARVFVPATAPSTKLNALRRLGADVVETATYDEAEVAAREAGRGGEAVYVAPYNDPDVIAGAGTVALEMFDECPELDVIVAPLGGGGLLSGTGIVAKSQRRPVTVIGAEAEASPVFTSGIAAGHIVTVDVQPTLADGLAGNLEPGSATFDLVRAVTDRIVAVTEASIARTMQDLVYHERLVVEGAGVTGVPALLQLWRQGDLDLGGRVVGVILSGRNVDGPVLARLLGVAGKGTGGPEGPPYE